MKQNGSTGTLIVGQSHTCEAAHSAEQANLNKDACKGEICFSNTICRSKPILSHLHCTRILKEKAGFATSYIPGKIPIATWVSLAFQAAD
jgi:hypothetical protein